LGGPCGNLKVATIPNFLLILAFLLLKIRGSIGALQTDYSSHSELYLRNTVHVIRSAASLKRCGEADPAPPEWIITVALWPLPFIFFSTLRSSHVEIMAIPSVDSSRIASYDPSGGHYSREDPVGDVPPRPLGMPGLSH
jgi:hypothetical protein